MSDAAQQRPLHPPLRRVSRGPKVAVSVGDQPQMLFAAPWECGLNVLTQTQSVPVSVAVGHLTAAAADTQDSCYSSCSEESHSSLSREASETLTAEISALSVSDNVSPHLLDFATKLGYTEAQLRFVLDKVGGGAPVGQDRVLAELIKLGKDVCRQPSANDSFSSAPSRQLRSVVIDGSNLAMTYVLCAIITSFPLIYPFFLQTWPQGGLLLHGNSRVRRLLSRSWPYRPKSLRATVSSRERPSRLSNYR